MNRNTKTIVSILGIVVLFLVLSVLAYYAGGGLAKNFIGTSTMKLSEWKDKYFTIVKLMGGFSGGVLLLWYLLSRFVLKVQDAAGAGKRTIWFILLAVEVVLCFAIPYGFASTHRGFPMSMMIPILFLLLYVVIGYWIGSVIVTADAFKYTPIGGSLVRAPKGRK